MNHPRPNCRAGFTLVELLVVIGIIAVLIAMLLPALSKAREQAKLVTCSAQLRQLGIAARAYAAENRDALPPWNLDDGSATYGAADGSANNGNPYVSAARVVNFPWWGNGNPTAGMLANPKSQPGANVGRLVVTGHLKGAWYRVQQCPIGYLGESRDPAGESANYNFNMHMARRVVGGVTYNQPWWKKISAYGRINKSGYTGYNRVGGQTFLNYQYPQRLWALASDPLMSNTGGNIGTQFHSSKTGYAVNLMMSDASVQTVNVPATINRASGVWDRFLELLGYVEVSGAGGGTGQRWTPNNQTVTGYAIVPVNP